jgi:hypothetical protein
MLNANRLQIDRPDLHQEGMSAFDIHKNIEAILGTDAIGYSTVTKSR